MKVCPVCNAKVFDDMGTCYECLYHFVDEPPAASCVDEPPTPQCTDRAAADPCIDGAAADPCIVEAAMTPCMDEPFAPSRAEESLESLPPRQNGSGVDGDGPGAASEDMAEKEDAATGLSRGWILRIEMDFPDDPSRSFRLVIDPSDSGGVSACIP